MAKMISADELIKRLRSKKPIGEIGRVTLEECIAEINYAEPVKPERPKGKWLSELSLYGEGKDKYECSICHRTIKVDPLHESLCDYPFCHCGADMKEVSECTKVL